MAQPGLPDPDEPADLLAAFTRARVAVEDHISLRERDEQQWYEQTLTDIVLTNARPFVFYAPFTQGEEGEVGADWLWWWVDETGECFGMLVQAKRLTRDGRRWKIDFQYNRGEQMARLCQAADLFEVPASYVLYCGTEAFRRDLTCGPRHATGCDRCRRAAVSIVTALDAKEAIRVVGPADAAVDAFHRSRPLEDFADPEAAAGQVFDRVNWDEIDLDLRKFLVLGQTGAREVAKRMFKVVSWHRNTGQYARGAIAEQVAVGSEAIFTDLPGDRGHYYEPYFPHILRGLRRQVPTYVLDVLAGQLPPPSVTEHLAGIVVVRC